MTSSRRLSDRKVKPGGNDRTETNRRLLTRPLCQKVYYTQETQFYTQNSPSLLAETSVQRMVNNQRLYDFAYSTVEVQIHGNLPKSNIQLRVFRSWQRETQMTTTLLFTYSQHGRDRCTVFKGLYAQYKLFKNFEQLVQLMSVTLQQTVEFWTSDEIIAAVSTQQENRRHKAGYGSAEARSSYWWCAILVSDRWRCDLSWYLSVARGLSDRKVKPGGNDRAETNRRLLTRPLCPKAYYNQAQFYTQNSASLLAETSGRMVNSQRLYDFAYSTVEVQIHGNLPNQHGCHRCTVFKGLYALYKLFKNFEQLVQLMSVTLQQTVEFWTSDEIIAAVNTQ
ncbi:hypothetical protein T12_12853 [Trichinella patagoniensis]|uniref:Uncharacterized protein n=1 Tax=Trichinella patagoniensis TaxID=990121 RepID=A0A0V0ZHT1_9BILA|nr:hypothetical protein T12_12853 [Trichinella patagoniensis]